MMVRLLTVILIALLGCSSSSFRGDADALPGEDAPPEIDTGQLERLIHVEINAVRTRFNLQIFAWDDSLAAIARAHSRDMGRTGNFSHTGSGGTLPSDRGISAGYDCTKDSGDYRYTGIAENIFMTYVYGARRTYHGPDGTRRTYDWKTPEQIVEDVVHGWMNSPGHRANILQERHDREGIGIVRAGDQLYITQNLC